jgi:hypothetical protein
MGCEYADREAIDKGVNHFDPVYKREWDSIGEGRKSG